MIVNNSLHENVKGVLEVYSLKPHKQLASKIFSTKQVISASTVRRHSEGALFALACEGGVHVYNIDGDSSVSLLRKKRTADSTQRPLLPFVAPQNRSWWPTRFGYQALFCAGVVAVAGAWGYSQRAWLVQRMFTTLS